MHENACLKLHLELNKLPKRTFADLRDKVPDNGVYFLFEKGEDSHGTERIVRVGSHTGKGNLAARLCEHVRLNKDRSIFRKHVGRALLGRDNDPYLDIWNLDFTERNARETCGHLIDRERQDQIETLVSRYIETRFTVSVLASGTSTEACKTEKLLIGTVSSCSTCVPSNEWLGKHAHSRIAESGLWQMQHLYKSGLTESEVTVLFCN